MIEATVTLTEPAAAEPTFDTLALSPDVRRALDEMGYLHPTPVQRAVFEPAAEGRSLVVQARTGTGKTAAFALPIVDRLVRPSVKAPQALILVPTRELALQVSREIEQIGRLRGTKVVAIYGGSSMTKQLEALEAGAQVVVGTPGRTLDHLRQKTLNPSSIRVLVLDEADEMLSMGFARELHAILELLPKNRQGLFFSATLPADIERLAQNQLKDPELITLSSDQVGALEVGHYVYVMRPGDKIGQLVRILDVEDPESAVIFCNTRDETQRVAEGLKSRGYDADWLNGDLPQPDRERVMSATREGRLRFLVATDVAARGIDISHLTHVINYDFPETAEQYVHRTGRTGRAGRTGTAIALVGPKDIGNLYLLRLTYRIRPIEKQLPSAGEMKTRAEMDLLQLFVEGYASRDVHEEDLSLARRVLTHDEAERIVAGLLRDHLGAREGDVHAAAAEARRARNPPVEPVDKPLPKRVAPDSTVPSATTPKVAARRPPARAEREPQGVAPRSSSSRREPARAPRREPSEVEDPSSRLPGVTVSEAPLTPGPAAKKSREEPKQRARAAQTQDDVAQVFINVGRRDGARAEDLEKLLSASGVAVEGPDGIRVRDRMSFILVKREFFDRAVSALSGQVIGGRAIVAEPARGARA